MNIMSHIEDNTLKNLCKTDKYAKSICDDNNFWLLKINNKYNGFPINKDFNKAKELYDRIYSKNSKIPNILYILVNKTNRSEWERDVLDWVDERDIVDIAIEENKERIVELLAMEGILPSQYGINLLARDNNLKLLKILSNYDIYPDEKGADLAVENDSDDVIGWLASKGILPSDFYLSDEDEYSYEDRDRFDQDDEDKYYEGYLYFLENVANKEY